MFHIQCPSPSLSILLHGRMRNSQVQPSGPLSYTSFIPFLLGQAEELQNYLVLVNPHIWPYCFGLTALIDTLQDQFIKGQHLLTHYFKDIPRINLPCNSWSQHIDKSTFGVNSHWVLKDFKLCEAIIGMERLKVCILGRISVTTKSKL